MKRLIVVVLFALGACGGSGYPESFTGAFMDNCLRTSGGELAYCNCALNYLEANVSYEDAQNGVGMSDAVEACIGEA